jgi:hypothetical protein
VLSDERTLCYDKDWPEVHELPHLTRRQLKRRRHKLHSRKTHEHIYLVVLTGERKGRKIAPDGEIFRCLRCKPLPWAEPVTVKAAEGPRDWTPEA